MAEASELAFNWGGASIRFIVSRSERQTLRIGVTPEGRIEVAAPLGASDPEIISRVRRRAGWISRQLARFDRWRPRTPPRQYDSGETHLYLGRQYRLLITLGSRIGVHLDGKRLVLTLSEPKDQVYRRTIVRHWYRLQSYRIFPERLSAVLPPFQRLGISRPPLIIREMKHRWGSFTGKGSLVLNLDLVRASPSLIDYVIAHELAHALHPDHGSDWEELLTRIMPDWRTRKDNLERELL